MSLPKTLALVQRCFVPAVWATALIIPVAVWLLATGDPLAYFQYAVPTGQSLYMLAKPCGLLALAAFWVQCMTALARHVPMLTRFLDVHPRQHAWLGGAIFVLVVAHVALIVAASSLRTGHFAGALLVPRFDQGFYSAHISYGALAFWLLGPAVVAGALRRPGRVQWRWPHRIVFVVFGLGLLHGMSIGSETRFGLMQYVYIFFVLSLVTALCSWMRCSLRRRVHVAGPDKYPQAARSDSCYTERTVVSMEN